MLKAIPPLPLKFRRRSVSAVRNFPKGCRLRASAASSKPIIAGTPPSLADANTTEDLSLSNPRKAEAQESRAPPLNIASGENEGLCQNNGELVAFDESRGSTLPEKMEIEEGSDGNEGVGENSGKLVASELQNPEEAEESNGSMMPLEKETSAKGDEGVGQSNGELDGKLKASELANGAETDGGEEEVRENRGVDEQFAEPETSELPAESLCLPEFGSRKFSPPKRRRVSVVRYLPSGCGRNAPRIGEETFVMAVSSESKTTGKKLDGLCQNNGELVAFDKSRGSTLPEKMEIEEGPEENEGVGENSGKLVASELPNPEEAEKSNGSMMPLEKETSEKGDEGMVQTNGKLDGKLKASELPNSAETDGGEEEVRENGGVDEQFAEPKTSELPAESLSLPEFGLRKYSPPKRRRVSVVRYFPSGCGRNAPRIGEETFVMAVSSESKTTGKKLDVGVGSTKEDDDDEVRRSDVGNEVVVESSTAKNEDDLGKKNGKPIRERMGRDSIGETGGKKLAVCVRRTEDEDEDDLTRHDVTSHVVVKSSPEKYESSPEKDEDDVGKKNSEPTRERKKVHDSSGERRFKSPKPRNSEGKTSAIKQVSKNLQVKESRDVRPQSGIKAGKPVDNVDIKSPKDGNTLKRKFSEEGVDEDHVMGVKSRGKKPLEAYGDGSIVQASETSTSSKLVILKSKAKDKLKMLSKRDGKGKSLVIDKTSQPRSAPLNHDRDSGSNNEGSSARDMVKRTLRLFQKLLQEEEANSKGPRRGDLNAASILKESNNWVNYGTPIIGDVPGVEVGDKFHWRVELSIIGLHRPFQGGIDYMKRGDGTILATSIVSSGGYPTNLESSDELIYSGSGGNPDAKKKKEAGDQILQRGNLALKNSIDAKTPVRVIYGGKLQHKSGYGDARAKTVTTFTYDGLYLVEEYWEEAGSRGFSVFKFKLRRLPRNRSTREDSSSDIE